VVRVFPFKVGTARGGYQGGYRIERGNGERLGGSVDGRNLGQIFSTRNDSSRPRGPRGLNDAIQQLFNQLLSESGGALAAKFFYAILVTLIVIFATIAVSRDAERAMKLEEERDKGLLGLGR
jgi:Family of unknown function (DUF5654)